ncbi:MAG: ABC transporter ATP-binding protein [Bacteroidota bacterium]
MLKLVNIEKSFKGFSLKNINLSISKGSYFMLVGKSGAGKTLLLEIISGLCNPDSGDIYINNLLINKTPIHKRNVGLVYQSQSLFPHLSVFENIAYPLKCIKVKKDIIQKQVQAISKEIEIEHLLSRRITALSGGEAQRVTIARALISNPEILLLDEPLSALDVQLKREMMKLMSNINKQGKTILHVTHDIDEILMLADSVAIIENGTIIQTGTTNEVFKSPKSEFVADLIGMKNFTNGAISDISSIHGE